jgi:hypothetical protein
MVMIEFNSLLEFLRKIPAIQHSIASGFYEDKNWWIKLSLDIENSLAWHVVQELAHVLNYLSVNERLPASFYPVSAPPYLNGGPKNYLYWIIESKESDFSPDELKGWLKARLPNPVNSIEEWNLEE